MQARLTRESSNVFQLCFESHCEKGVWRCDELEILAREKVSRCVSFGKVRLDEAGKEVVVGSLGVGGCGKNTAWMATTLPWSKLRTGSIINSISATYKSGHRF